MAGKGLLTELTEARFYGEWEDRFEGNHNSYITPDDSKVLDWSKRIKENSHSIESKSDREKAMEVWAYVYNNTTYKLSKKWKRPRETIRSGIGDCEDFTFLIASILPNVGVDKSLVALGHIEFPTKEIEYHTWNIVDGMNVDATGSIEAAEKVKYVREQTWEVEVQ